MTSRAERRATARWIDRIGLVGVALSIVFAALTWLQPAWADRLQAAWFDAYQSLAPRQVSVLPVTVVEIDQKSLAAIDAVLAETRRLEEITRGATRLHVSAAYDGMEIAL